MTTETVTVDEAAIEAGVQAEIEAARKAVQGKLNGITKLIDTLRDAARIRHEYFALHPKDSISVHYGCLYVDVEVCAALFDFGTLPVLLRLVREAGYHRTTRSVTEWGGIRYVYRKPKEWSHAIELTIETTTDSEAVCRRVKVGSRTVQQPIYEIQCDGKSVVDEPEPQEVGR